MTTPESWESLGHSSWWASSSETLATYPELRVTCRVQSNLLGATFVVRVGSRITRVGYRFTDLQAWQAINRHLSKLTRHGEPVETGHQ